jgi:aminopeptidase N
VGVACEGLGASAWWPLKDHLSDEPDSMRISLIAKDDLVAVANGELRSRRKLAGNFDRWEWFVSYPINSYGLSFYLGDYEHFSDVYENGDSRFPLDYYVLAGNEEVAKKHFDQVTPMLKIFEKYFGPYPFPKDGYALVESSYWGMEHQSAIAYGNNFENEELWGFDFIIIHESAHEWFGNSLSVGDLGELWINEAFATYAEMVYLEDRFGREKAEQYLLSQRRRILNKRPMLGPMEVNYRNAEDSDIYFKGSWMLHSLRNTVDNDSLWFATLYDYATEHRLSILTTEQVVSFFNQKLGSDYSYHFNQYLKHAALPVLEWKIKGKKKNTQLVYRWDAAEEDFRMPIHLKMKGKKLRLTPSTEWQSFSRSRLKANDIELSTMDFLFEVKAVE